eukprot:TRINITY_DN10977_c0_g1_i4.p1 TRINITY_DN10977_c0_g1~~TRINITY_DN10977_c0_g1_i4.p1  ORF type:complete len:896 (+),score=143.88 TRINITY_DN10977_c0_g1_i4:138-2825(+)
MRAAIAIVLLVRESFVAHSVGNQSKTLAAASHSIKEVERKISEIERGHEVLADSSEETGGGKGERSKRKGNDHREHHRRRHKRWHKRRRHTRDEKLAFREEEKKNLVNTMKKVIRQEVAKSKVNEKVEMQEETLVKMKEKVKKLEEASKANAAAKDDCGSQPTPRPTPCPPRKAPAPCRTPKRTRPPTPMPPTAKVPTPCRTPKRTRPPTPMPPTAKVPTPCRTPKPTRPPTSMPTAKPTPVPTSAPPEPSPIPTVSPTPIPSRAACGEALDDDGSSDEEADKEPTTDKAEALHESAFNSISEARKEVKKFKLAEVEVLRRDATELSDLSSKLKQRARILALRKEEKPKIVALLKAKRKFEKLKKDARDFEVKAALQTNCCQDESVECRACRANMTPREFVQSQGKGKSTEANGKAGKASDRRLENKLLLKTLQKEELTERKKRSVGKPGFSDAMESYREAEQTKDKEEGGEETQNANKVEEGEEGKSGRKTKGKGSTTRTAKVAATEHRSAESQRPARKARVTFYGSSRQAVDRLHKKTLQVLKELEHVKVRPRPKHGRNHPRCKGNFPHLRRLKRKRKKVQRQKPPKRVAAHSPMRPRWSKAGGGRRMLPMLPMLPKKKGRRPTKHGRKTRRCRCPPRGWLPRRRKKKSKKVRREKPPKRIAARTSMNPRWSKAGGRKLPMLPMLPRMKKATKSPTPSPYFPPVQAPRMPPPMMPRIPCTPMQILPGCAPCTAPRMPPPMMPQIPCNPMQAGQLPVPISYPFPSQATPAMMPPRPDPPKAPRPDPPKATPPSTPPRRNPPKVAGTPGSNCMNYKCPPNLKRRQPAMLIRCPGKMCTDKVCCSATVEKSGVKGGKAAFPEYPVQATMDPNVPLYAPVPVQAQMAPMLGTPQIAR